jgi:hypothetical protein
MKPRNTIHIFIDVYICDPKDKMILSIYDDSRAEST